MARQQILFTGILVFLMLMAIPLLLWQRDDLSTSDGVVSTELVTVMGYITVTPDPLAIKPIRIVASTPDAIIVTANWSNLTEAGCITHTVAESETVFSIAEAYNVNPFLMLQANNLDEDSIASVQAGDELIVPIETCSAENMPRLPQFTATPKDAVFVEFPIH